MGTFIPSVASALWNGSSWLLQKVISVFNESSPPQTPSSHSYSPPGPPHAPHDIPSRQQPPRPATTSAPEVFVPQEDHESLRLQARQEGDRMAECFRQSRDAFARNEKKLAKDLSLMGQAHKENMVRLNKEASAKVFQENNQGAEPNTIDLHGLYVTEAEFYFKRAVQSIHRGGSLRVIVGKGNHSDGNTPKIKPAIQALGRSLGMIVDVDPVNEGCLIVNFR